MRIARRATQILPLVEKHVATTEHLYFNVWTELDKMNVSLPRTPYPKSSLSHHQLFTRAAVQQQTVEYGSTMMSWPEDRFRYSMKSSKQNRITERTIRLVAEWKHKIWPSSTRAHRQQNWVGIYTNQWELRESTEEPSFLLLEAHVATAVLANLAPVSTVLRRTPSAPIALFLASPQWRIFRCRLLLALLRSYTSLTRDDKSAVKVLRWQKQRYQSEAYVLKANVLRSCFHWMRPCSDCTRSSVRTRPDRCQSSRVQRRRGAASPSWWW